MLQLTDISLHRGEKILFDHADLTLYENHKVGIVGANGCGKSSLFALLLNQLQTDTGSITLPKHLKWGVIEQQTPHSDNLLVDYVLEGDAELQRLQAELADAESKQDGLRIAALHGRLQDIDAYSAPARAASLLIDLGFSQTQLHQSVNSLSGGWRMRLNLCKALLSRADLLLLDEPTNHLDLEGIMGLENWLKQYNGTLLVISHDREFLDHITEQTVFIDQQKFKLYGGNYSLFEKQYATELALQQAMFEKQQKKIAHMQSYVDRFRYKASKAKQAQSRLKAISKLETVAAIQVKSPFQFEFLKAPSSGNPMLHGRKLDIGYSESAVLKNVTFSLAEGDRIALIGPNGAGKSTLIKLLAEQLQPISGDFVRNNKLKVGYFAQHQIEQLILEQSPLAHLLDLDPHISEQAARNFLGGFYFHGNRVLEPIRHFSGGEKARLALALLIWQQPNLLLLDEPTNHLDMQMREALSLALQDFNGAVVLVSHDRYLLEATADELWLVANHQVQTFTGDLHDYAQWFTEYQKQQTASAEVIREEKPVTVVENRSHKTRAQQEAHDRKLRKLESKINEWRDKLTAIHDQQAQIAAAAMTDEAQAQLVALSVKQNEIQAKIDTLEEEWLLLSEQ